MLSEDKIYRILDKCDVVYFDGEFWLVLGFNEEECYLEHCDYGEELEVPLKDLATADFYELRKIEVEGVD